MELFTCRWCVAGLLVLSVAGCSGPSTSVDGKAAFPNAPMTVDPDRLDPSRDSDPYVEAGSDPYGSDPDVGAYWGGYASATVVTTLGEEYTFEDLTLGIEEDVFDGDFVDSSWPPRIRVWMKTKDGARDAVVSQSTNMFFRPLIRFSESEKAFYFVSYAGDVVWGEDWVFEPTLYRIDSEGVRTKSLPRLVFEVSRPTLLPDLVRRYELNLFAGPGVSVFEVSAPIRVSRDEDETRTRTFVEHFRLKDFD